MLKRSDLDQIDSFLMGATLQDVIKIVHVCQTLTAECRLMLDVIDQRTEEFFNHEVTTNSSREERGASALRNRESKHVGNSPEVPAHSQARTAVDSRPTGSEASTTRPKPEGDRPAEERNPSGLGEGQVVQQTLGGEVLNPDNTQPVGGKVKRKRGRPRKNKETTTDACANP
jgi:hypothetical protein